MYWHGWWIGAVAVFGIAVADAIATLFFRYKRKRIITPNRALIFGTWGSGIVMFYPLYLRELEGWGSVADYIKAGVVSIQHAIRLFAFDGEYMDIVDMVNGLEPEIQTMYTLFGAILYLIAPVLTVGLILSFFKNLTAYISYLCSFWKDTHVFSELNEKSLALAKSIDDVYNKKGQGETRRYKFWKKALIVFTDVLDGEDEETLELLEEAKEIGAILFTKDLESIQYRKRYLSVRKVNFYLISDDEEEKIRHAESIMRDYDFSDKIELRLFSDDIRSELLLAAKNVQRIKVIRINDIQSLVYHNLDANGMRLFERSRETAASEKTISAVIVGLGKYGMEMLKALTWFCQMPGYRIKIHAFDADEHAKETVTQMCPELMSDALNGQNIPGEACYDITVHGGMDTNSPAFYEELARITDATYVFVCLGNDEVNLETAIKIRTLCERIQYVGDHHKPDIETVIYDSNIRNTMGVKWTATADDVNPQGVVNFKKQSYDIHMIGDLEHFYCVETLIDSALVEEGKQVHLRWGDEGDFWKFEYNYRSSIAKAIHERLRVKMKLDIPGVSKEWNNRTDEEKLAIGQIEHVRWNAYMRTEGYQYSGSQNKASRNDLGKVHHNLVSVTELSDDDLRKDA
jgi:hypothetical protein